MKQYDDDFLRCIENIDTKSSPSLKKEIDATYRAVMKESGLRKRTPGVKKGGRILLIAAAIAVCTVVTAAAYGFSTGNLFKGFFESNGSSEVNGIKPAVSLSENQVAKINEAGILPNRTVTDNGTTVQVRAVAGDKSCTYILLDVIAPEGTVLDKDKYEFEDMPIDFHNIGENKGSSAGWDISTQKDDNPNDNKKSFVISLSCAGMDLQNREIQLTLKNLCVPTGKLAYRTVIKGQWQFNLKLDYETNSKNIEVNKVTHFSGNCSTIRTVNLSALSATVDFTEHEPHTGPGDFCPPDLIIQLKDGTKYTILSGPATGNSESVTITYQFKAPLVFDKVAKITLGDLEIPLE